MSVLVLLCASGIRASEKPIPEQAVALHARLAPALQPAVREWVSAEAKKISKDSKAGEATVKADIQARFAGQPLADADVEALAFLVMMEATQAARDDLRGILDNVKASSSQKAAQRQAAGTHNKADAAGQGAGQQIAQLAATNLPVRPAVVMAAGHGSQLSANLTPAKQDAVTGITDQDMLQLQQAMDRRSQLETMLSNLMKKAADAQSNLVGNLK